MYAQSNVEIYGLVGAYVGSMQRSNAQVHTLQEGHGSLTTSCYGFRGHGDVGGGVKVIFQLEHFFQPDTGASGRSATDHLHPEPLTWQAEATISKS